MNDYNKRVLLIDNGYILGSSGTSITMRFLFENFKKDNFLCYCVNHNVLVTNEEYKDRTIIANEKNNIVQYIIEKFLKVFRVEKNKLVNSIDSKKGDSFESKKMKIIRGILSACPYIISKEEKEKIKQFSPDIIYTTGGDIAVYKNILKINRYLKKPILVHYMDDFITENVRFKNCGVFSILNNKLMRLNKKAIKNSASIICISEKMANEYHKILLKKTYVIMNSVLLNREPHPYKEHMKKKMIYVGSMTLSRDHTIKKICEVINKKEYSDVVEFEIYTSSTSYFDNYYRNINSDNVHLYNLISHESIIRKIDESDICVYAEDFSNEAKKYCKYSFSTKIAEFLSLGKPIFCVCPSELAVYEEIFKNNCGYFASNENEIKSTIDKIIEDNEIINKSVCAFNLFKEKYNGNIMKNRFIEIISGECDDK